MRVSMIELIVDAKRSDVENALKNSELVDDFEIEDLDDRDVRKSVLIVFKELVDSKFLDDVLKQVLPIEEIKIGLDE